MASEQPAKKKPRPKRRIKHTPGRDHDRKSAARKKRRFARKAERKRQEEEQEAKKAWREWDALSDDAKRLLGPVAAPKMPRPADD